MSAYYELSGSFGDVTSEGARQVTTHEEVGLLALVMDRTQPCEGPIFGVLAQGMVP